MLNKLVADQPTPGRQVAHDAWIGGVNLQHLSGGHAAHQGRNVIERPFGASPRPGIIEGISLGRLGWDRAVIHTPAGFGVRPEARAQQIHDLDPTFVDDAVGLLLDQLPLDAFAQSKLVGDVQPVSDDIAR